MPTRQGSSCSKNLRICTRRNVFLTATSPALLIPWTWKTFLARSRPIVVISIADGSFGSWLLDSFHDVALRRREQEPSTPSALGQKRSFVPDQPNVPFAPKRPFSQCPLAPKVVAVVANWEASCPAIRESQAGQGLGSYVPAECWRGKRAAYWRAFGLTAQFFTVSIWPPA